MAVEQESVILKHLGKSYDEAKTELVGTEDDENYDIILWAGTTAKIRDRLKTERISIVADGSNYIFYFYFEGPKLIEHKTIKDLALSARYLVNKSDPDENNGKIGIRHADYSVYGKSDKLNSIFSIEHRISPDFVSEPRKSETRLIIPIGVAYSHQAFIRSLEELYCINEPVKEKPPVLAIPATINPKIISS